MHTSDEYRRILELWARGISKNRISLLTRISRTPVREGITRFQNVAGLGDHWTLASNGRNIQIARRADLAFLDQFIGPKS